MAKFKKGDRVQRVETKERGIVQDVTEDPSQVYAPEWYSVIWDGSDVLEDVVYPQQLIVVMSNEHTPDKTPDEEIKPEEIHVIHKDRDGRIGPTVKWDCPACGCSNHQADSVMDGGEWLVCSNKDCGRSIHVMLGPDGKDFQANLEAPEDNEAD